MDILQEIIDSLKTEDHVILATIISTNGSTPASAFSKMLVRDGGKRWTGTVGGGCMEGDVLQEAIGMFNSASAKVLTFHLNETNVDQGLICGGNLDILIEPISKRDLPFIAELKAYRDNGDDCVIVTSISQSGRVDSKVCIASPAALINEDSSRPGRIDRTTMDEAVRKAFHQAETQRMRTEAGEVFIEPIGGIPHLIIFGGGHVSKYISRAASMAGFRITVVDDRPEYANPQRFPEAEKTLAVDFSEAFQHLQFTPSTYTVIVTRGHRSDEEILERVIALPTKYIGMIGSKRKILTTYGHLKERGVSSALLENVHAPVGLEIGAATAEEIGISVVAQLIAIRRGRITQI